MNERTKNIIEWQKVFREAPVIYFTACHHEGQEEPTYNFYDSKEAAQIEVDKYPKRRLKIGQANIHSLEVSKTRWNGFTK